MAEHIHINRRVQIPLSELHFTFSRSGGRGGQNVNKVETRVELSFDVAASNSLTDIDRDLVMKRLGSRIDTGGTLRIVSQESRSQWQNKIAAIERFAELMRKALVPPKKRIATRTPTKAKERRLATKKHRSTVKAQRRIREE